jgi:transposase-like protein
LEITVKKYSTTAPRLAVWMEDNLPEGFTVFSFPTAHRRRLRSTNMLERLNKGIKHALEWQPCFPMNPRCCAW